MEESDGDRPHFSVRDATDGRRYKVFLRQEDFCRLKVAKIRRTLSQVAGVPLAAFDLYAADGTILVDAMEGREFGLADGATLTLVRQQQQPQQQPQQPQGRAPLHGGGREALAASNINAHHASALDDGRGLSSSASAASASATSSRECSVATTANYSNTTRSSSVVDAATHFPAATSADGPRRATTDGAATVTAVMANGYEPMLFTSSYSDKGVRQTAAPTQWADYGAVESTSGVLASAAQFLSLEGLTFQQQALQNRWLEEGKRAQALRHARDDQQPVSGDGGDAPRDGGVSVSTRVARPMATMDDNDGGDGDAVASALQHVPPVRIRIGGGDAPPRSLQTATPSLSAGATNDVIVDPKKLLGRHASQRSSSNASPSSPPPPPRRGRHDDGRATADGHASGEPTSASDEARMVISDLTAQLGTWRSLHESRDEEVAALKAERARMQDVVNELREQADGLHAQIHEARTEFLVAVPKAQQTMAARWFDDQLVSVDLRRRLASSEEAARTWERKHAMERDRRVAAEHVIDDLKGGIRVVVRVRPPLVVDARSGHHVARLDVAVDAAQVAYDDVAHRMTVLNPALGTKVYEFYRVMGPHAAAAAQLFEDEVAPLVRAVTLGQNACVLAYGQTGSGKTHTIVGDPSGPSDREHQIHTPHPHLPSNGVLPCAIRMLFQLMADAVAAGAIVSFTVTVAMVELYNDRVIDLLPPTAAPAATVGSAAVRNGKTLAETAGSHRAFGSAVVKAGSADGGGAVVDVRLPSASSASYEGTHHATLVGVPGCAALTADAALRLILQGLQRRSTDATEANDVSSRSHALVFLSLATRRAECAVVQHSKLVFADLAGSERVAKSASAGLRLQEAQYINRSLSALGDVVHVLSASSKAPAGSANNNIAVASTARNDIASGNVAPSTTHVPYRNSKLTMLLSDCITGARSRTLLVACVAPTTAFENNTLETLSTLTFASRVKCVRSMAFTRSYMMAMPVAMPATAASASTDSAAAAPADAARGRPSSRGALIEPTPSVATSRPAAMALAALARTDPHPFPRVEGDVTTTTTAAAGTTTLSNVTNLGSSKVAQGRGGGGLSSDCAAIGNGTAHPTTTRPSSVPRPASSGHVTTVSGAKPVAGGTTPPPSALTKSPAQRSARGSAAAAHRTDVDDRAAPSAQWAHPFHGAAVVSIPSTASGGEKKPFR